LRHVQFVTEGISSDMTQEALELLQKALMLAENERAELAGNLIASLDTTVDQNVDAAWQQEALRRLDDIQSGQVETSVGGIRRCLSDAGQRSETVTPFHTDEKACLRR
jgi:putative addiction module component (TIGR02574 family)